MLQTQKAGLLARPPLLDVTGSAPTAPERLVVTVRRGDPADAGVLAAMLRGLSPTSGFQRFLVGFGEPKPALVRTLLATGPQRGALLAVLPDGRTVGHACWSVSPDAVADVGVVVTDAWQRRGLGRQLVETAVFAAGSAGARRLHLDVHPENRLVVRLLRERLPRARRWFADGLVQFEAAIESPVEAAVGIAVEVPPAAVSR